MRVQEEREPVNTLVSTPSSHSGEHFEKANADDSDIPLSRQLLPLAPHAFRRLCTTALAHRSEFPFEVRDKRVHGLGLGLEFRRGGGDVRG